MGSVNLDSFRAAMGKYNLGSIELTTGKNGESNLTKVDNHKSWLMGRIFNASTIGEGSHVGQNFAARQALYDAFCADVKAKYSESSATKAFLDRARGVLLGKGVATQALMRNEVVAKLLNDYDAARLSWKPLSERSIVANGNVQPRDGREMNVSKWAADTLKAYAEGNHPLSKDDLGSVAFLAGISETEVETLLKTRKDAIQKFLDVDVRLSNLNNPPPEMAAELKSGKITERHIEMVALQRAVYYVKTGDVPDDLKKALGLDVPPQESPAKVEPAKGEPAQGQAGDVPQEPAKAQGQKPNEVKPVPQEAPKDPIKEVSANLEKLLKAADDKAHTVENFLSYSCKPYADQIAAACPEDCKTELAQAAQKNLDLIKSAQNNLEELKKKSDITGKQRETAAEKLLADLKGSLTDLEPLSKNVVNRMAEAAKHIYEELGAKDDPDSKLTFAKMRFVLTFYPMRPADVPRQIVDEIASAQVPCPSDYFFDVPDQYPTASALNPDLADSVLRLFCGIPPDSPIPDKLQTPETFETIVELGKAFANVQSNCEGALNKGGLSLFSLLGTSFKGLEDVLASGALNNLSPDRMELFVACCMLAKSPEYSAKCGSNAIELLSNLTKEGVTLQTLPLVQNATKPEASSCIAYLRTMNGGSLRGIEEFCQRAFGKSSNELTGEEVRQKYTQWREGAASDPLENIPKAEQEAFQLVNGALTFFERLEKKTSVATVKGDMMALMDAVRTLDAGNAGDSAEVSFKRCKFTLVRDESGGLSMTIGKKGQKLPGKLPVSALRASLENDLFMHAKNFGIDLVSRYFPNSGDESPSAREKFLRVVVAFTGVNALELSRVPTDELAKFANALAKGENPDPAVRFADYLNSGYQLDNQAELEKTLELKPDGAQTNGICKSLKTDNIYDIGSTNVIKAWENAEEIEKSTIVFNQPPKTDEQKVHDFVADLVLDKEAWKYDAHRGKSGNARIQEVFSRHMDVMVLLMKRPTLITDALDVKKFGLEENDIELSFGENEEKMSLQELRSNLTQMFSVLNVMVARQLEQLGINLAEINTDKPLTKELRGAVNFAFERFFHLASAGKDEIGAYADYLFKVKDLEAEVDRLQASYKEALKAEGKAEQPKSNAGGLFGAFSKFLAAGKKESTNLLVALKSAEARLTAAKGLAEGARLVIPLIGDLDGKIGMAADKVADLVQEKIADGIAELIGEDKVSKPDVPVWQQSLSELQQAGVIDPNSGYGAFLKNAAKVYFAGMTADDRRQMLASGIRFSAGAKDLGDLAGALVKGMGPLMLKILQGIPLPMIPEKFQGAFKDIKSHLAPIPEEYVKAQLLQLKRNSGGKISSIEVKRVLGAASVGEALLCRVKTVDNPFGEDVVVKILRPDAKARLLREEKVFKTAAKAAGEGMAITYEGQLARIKEEFDFLLEAENVAKGKTYDHPVYNLKEPGEFGDVHSMKINPLSTPTTDVIMLEKAPGVTVDNLVENTAKAREKLINENTEITKDKKKRVFKSEKAYTETRRKLVQRYDDLRDMQSKVKNLASVWVEEAIFRGGFFHGDLHAGNMLVDSVEGVTVIDYGNATKLSAHEQTAMLRLSMYAGIQETEKFFDTFVSILTPKGQAQINRPGVKEKLLEDIREVFAKGTGKDVAGRMFGAIALIQRANIETPPAIYNFMQSMMRLAGTLESMAAELNAIKDDLTTIELPEGVKREDLKLEAPWDFMDAIDSRLSINRLISYLPFWDSVVFGLSKNAIADKLTAELNRSEVDFKAARNAYEVKCGGLEFGVQEDLDARLGDLLFPRNFLAQIGEAGWTSNPETVKTFMEVFKVNFENTLSDLREKETWKDQNPYHAMGYMVAHHLARYPELAKAVKDLSPDSYKGLKDVLMRQIGTEEIDDDKKKVYEDDLSAFLDLLVKSQPFSEQTKPSA